MSTSAAPADAPKKRKLSPGLGPGVIVIAGLCFLLLMGTGTVALVQTLTATQKEMEAWPVARKHLGTVVSAEEAARAESERAAALLDIPGQGTGGARGGTRYMGSDAWMQAFPELQATVYKPAKNLTPEALNYLYNFPLLSRGFAMNDPSSPFRYLGPRSPDFDRYLVRRQAYLAAKARGEAPGSPTDDSTSQR